MMLVTANWSPSTFSVFPFTYISPLFGFLTGAVTAEDN